MCGICGFSGFTAKNENISIEDTIVNMMSVLAHRGPDIQDHWRAPDAGVVLGHTRLSIIDLSQAGNQPMQSSCDRFVIVYNGEIYNAPQLREELVSSGRKFRGHSDTEVIIEGCAVWGIRKTVEKLIGMFAFAVWDKQKKILFLVRDRLGIKPLYWGRFGGFFLFASELKALRAQPDWQPEINRHALVAYMRHSYTPTPLTIYKGIYKLLPGSILTLKKNQDPIIERYWDMESVAQTGLHNQFANDEQEAVIQLQELLSSAVENRMVSDVPLGALLSGGIDSSTVVALMQANSTRPIKTFTVGFHETGFDEARHALAIAKHLGTDHTELYVTPDETRDIIPMLADIYDEPFADASQIPTYIVSKLTRQFVTVALSGDGGDEVFAGYNRYFHGKNLMQANKYLPRFIRQIIIGMINQLTPDTWSKLNYMLPDRLRIPQFGDKTYKVARLLDTDPGLMYQYLVSHWDDPAALVLHGQEPESILMRNDFAPDICGVVERMQLLDTITYLPDDILTKVDRASMAVSLEARVPFLDHRVVEFAWRLPIHMKIRNGKGKWILRQILYKFVPRELVERPKMGFGVPVGEWLRGPLRDWAEELLDEKYLQEQGLLNYGPIKNKWHEHQSGRGNWQYHLWDILMFQSWYKRWMT